VREGVGIESSLRWVSARFAQRALTDFFDGGQQREFVIDAAAAAEFTAKTIVARHDVTALFDPDHRNFSPAQLHLLDPHDNAGILVHGSPERIKALDGLVASITITGLDAARAARSLADIEVDLAAASRLFDARNAAIHLGDLDESHADRIARDFLSVVNALWAGVGFNDRALWGDLRSIATPKHLRSSRTPVQDAEVRVARARRDHFSSVISANRRGRLPLADADTRCPACNSPAFTTMQPVGTAPERCIPPTRREQPVEVLDCLVCGLVLYGTKQIEWATHAAHRWHQPAPLDVAGIKLF